MKLFFLNFIFLVNCVYSQNSFEGYVLVKNNGLPIENANVIIKKRGSFFNTVSDYRGKFKFADTRKEEIESIEVSHVSFFKTKTTQIVDSIFYLSEKTNNLNEVFISSEKQKMVYSLSTFDKTFIHVRNFSWENKIAVYIPQEVFNKGKKIKKLLYAISDFEGVKGLKYQPFIANIFSVDTITGLPNKALIKNGMLVKKNDERKWTEVDVSAYNFIIPPEGIYIVMEILNKDKYPTDFIQSKIGVISAVPAIKSYSYNKNYIRKSYIQGRYLLSDNQKDIWIEEHCHYLIDVEF